MVTHLQSTFIHQQDCKEVICHVYVFMVSWAGLGELEEHEQMDGEKDHKWLKGKNRAWIGIAAKQKEMHKEVLAD